MTSEKSYTGWYFLLIVIAIYITVLFITPEKVLKSLGVFVGIIIKVIPVIILVFVLMAITNYFIKPSFLVKFMGKKSGVLGWVIAIIAGIISTGPIYMWYPLLADLKKKGVRKGLIATFLYNRAIKIPLLPMIILYFGLPYTIVLTIVMIVVSVVQGLIIEKLVGVKK